jgi:alkylhydroperoxidase/carboxymuconolactone decarboxylase family protein YurZ
MDPTIQAAVDAIKAKPREDVRKRLGDGDKEFQTLKKNYHVEIFNAFAPRLIIYPKADKFVDWIRGSVYADPEAQDPLGCPPPSTLQSFEREIVVIALAAIKGDAYTLFGHFYWALMEDKSAKPVEHVADILMTVGAYAGVDCLRWSLAVFGDVLDELKDAGGSDNTADTASVLQRFAKRFPKGW